MTDIEHRIRSSFRQQSMMATLDASLELIAPGHVVISAPVTSRVQQQHGYAHAALAFAIGDSAAGYAALTELPLDVEVVTAEMKINLIAPTLGNRLQAHGHLIKSGKRLIVVRATVIAFNKDQQKDIAVLQGTMVPVGA